MQDVGALAKQTAVEKVTQVAPWVAPVTIIAAAIALGVVVDRVIVGQLKRLARRSRWQYDKVILRALGRLTIVWFALAGVNLALYSMPLDGDAVNQVGTGIQVVIIATATIVCARILVDLFRMYTRRLHSTLPASSLFASVIAAFVYLTGALVILQTLSIPITPILTALGIGGLAVALALQETLSNFFAGIHLILSRKVRIGDFIRLEPGFEGYVSDITWRNTTITTLQNNTVLIPNSKIGSAIVTNYYRPGKEISVIVSLSVSYDSDLDEVERVTVEVAREVADAFPGAVTTFTPLARFDGFGESGIDLSVILRATEFVDQFSLKHLLIKALHRRYRERNIEIPYPTRTVHLSPPEPPTNGVAVASQEGAYRSAN